MAVLLGLLVSATYGAGDFFGGLSAKRVPAATVVVLSQVSGLPLLALLVALTGGDPTPRTFLLGAAAGAFGAVGLTSLYRGLASGRMSVVAPITAVGAAVVPALWGIVQGERPGGVALAGVVVAVVAVGVISRVPDEPVAEPGGHEPGGSVSDEDAGDARRATRSAVLLAMAAGVAFGTVFILLAATGDGVGFWPLVAGRTTSVVLLLVGAAAVGRRVSIPERGARPSIAAAGVLDVSANALYLLAARQGLLALVAVLSSLYPASTVLLARVVLHERLTRVQLGGLGLAGAGVVLIAAG